MELHKLTAHELTKLIAQKKTSPKEVARDLLKRIDKAETKIKALCLVDKQDVLAQCDALEKGSRKGRLLGVPVVIKDNICVEGQETTCSSRY